MKKLLFPIFALLIYNVAAFAQGSPIPRGNYAYPVLDRLEILNGIEAPYHSSLRYYQRGSAVKFALQLDSAKARPLSTLDRDDLTYIFQDNNEWLGQKALPNTLGGAKYKPDGDTTLGLIKASCAIRATPATKNNCSNGCTRHRPIYWRSICRPFISGSIPPSICNWEKLPLANSPIFTTPVASNCGQGSMIECLCT